jgi:hypothetical protein
MGLVRGPGTAAVVGGNLRPCTSVLLFSRGGPGGAVPDVGGENPGPNEPGRGTSVVEETEGRRQELVTIRVQAVAPLLALGGTNRTRGWMPKSQRKPRIRGRPGGNCPVRRASGLVTVRVH